MKATTDWLVDQREERLKKGVWKAGDDPRAFPAGHPYEEMIAGLRAWRAWKRHFSIKRQYEGQLAL